MEIQEGWELAEKERSLLTKLGDALLYVVTSFLHVLLESVASSQSLDTIVDTEDSHPVVSSSPHHTICPTCLGMLQNSFLQQMLSEVKACLA